MMWTTHLLFGLVSYLALVKLGVVPNSAELIIAVSIGSLIPDIDHPKSYISHLNGFLQMSSRVISLGGHRGVTHTIFAFILSFPLALLILRVFGRFSLWPALAFSLGYLMHLFADSLTSSGVAWFFPFDKHRIRWAVRTGSISELGIFALLIFVVWLMLP